MDEYRNIGLIIWGCNGGYKSCLFSNNVVNVNDGDIYETVRDVRSYVRFLRPHIDYYALEFTSKYKVFTIYRSSYDFGDGAYIAITVYVPHNKKFQNVRSVLLEMMDRYFLQYISPLSGEHKEGEPYDINLFQDILRNHSVDIISETACCKSKCSKGNNIPQLYVYNNLDKVDEYFGFPYREVFLKSQKVIMVSRESVSEDKKDDYLPNIDTNLHKITDNEVEDSEPIFSGEEVVDVLIECEQITPMPITVESNHCSVDIQTRDLSNGESGNDNFRDPFICLHDCDMLYCKYIASDGTTALGKIEGLKDCFFDGSLNCICLAPKGRTEYEIYDNNGKVLCSVQFTESKYLENKGISNENKKNGFKIEWKDDKCHIYYKPNQNKLLEQINNFIRKNVNKAMLLLLLFLICGFGVYGIYKLFSGRNQVLPYRIVFVGVDDEPMEIDKSSIKGFSDSVAVSGDTLLLYKEIKEENEIIEFKDKWYSVNLQEVHKAYSDSISNHFSGDKKQTKPLKINIEKFIPPFKIVFCKKSDKSIKIKKIKEVAEVCEYAKHNDDTLLLFYSCLNEMKKDSVHGVIYFGTSKSNDLKNNKKDLILFADLKKDEQIIDSIKSYFYGKQKQDSFLLFEVAPMVDAKTAFNQLRDSLTKIIAKINNKTNYSSYEGEYNALLDDYKKEYSEDNAKAINGYKKFLAAYKAFLFCTKDDGWNQVVNIDKSYKKYLSEEQKKWFANTYACNEVIFKILCDQVPGIDLQKAWDYRTNDKKEKKSGIINWPEIK